MEEDLKKLIPKYWGGFTDFNKLRPIERESIMRMHSIEEFYNAIKEAYNLGIQIAAKYIDASLPEEEDKTIVDGTELIENLTIK